MGFVLGFLAFHAAEGILFRSSWDWVGPSIPHWRTLGQMGPDWGSLGRTGADGAGLGRTGPDWAGRGFKDTDLSKNAHDVRTSPEGTGFSGPWSGKTGLSDGVPMPCFQKTHTTFLEPCPYKESTPKYLLIVYSDLLSFLADRHILRQNSSPGIRDAQAAGPTDVVDDNPHEGVVPGVTPRICSIHLP